MQPSKSTVDEQIAVENVIKQLKASITTVVGQFSLELLRAGEKCLEREISSLAGAF